MASAADVDARRLTSTSYVLCLDVTVAEGGKRSQAVISFIGRGREGGPAGWGVGQGPPQTPAPSSGEDVPKVQQSASPSKGNTEKREGGGVWGGTLGRWSQPIDAAKDRAPGGSRRFCGSLGGRMRRTGVLFSTERKERSGGRTRGESQVFLAGKVGRTAVLALQGRASRPGRSEGGRFGLDAVGRNGFRERWAVAFFCRAGVERSRRTCHDGSPLVSRRNKWLAAEIAHAGWDPTGRRDGEHWRHQTRTTAMGSRPTAGTTLASGHWRRGTRGSAECLGWGTKRRARS